MRCDAAELQSQASLMVGSAHQACVTEAQVRDSIINSYNNKKKYYMSEKNEHQTCPCKVHHSS